MSDPSNDPSINNEPHMRDQPPHHDPSEEIAEQHLARDHEHDDPEEQAVERSVWDELSTSPELTGDTPHDALTYQKWLVKHHRQTTVLRSWAITIAVTLLAGIWAVLGSLWSGMQTTFTFGLLATVVFGPVAEEVMKIAAALYIVEKRPYLFRSPLQIVICVLASAVVFATIENVIYLNIYDSTPSSTMVYWRWTVCVALHVGCSLIAGLGLVRIWADMWKHCRRPTMSLGFPFLVTAILVHGAYNAFVTVLSLAGFDF